MRYILDDNGYIEAVSCTFIECNNKSCTEYIGAIPEGYESLVDWVLNANIRAYKIVDNDLVYDEARAAELEEEWENCSKLNIMTIGLTANATYTVNTAWSYATTLCDSLKTKIGNKLTFENNAIKIGSGIKYVKVSANVMCRGIVGDQIAGITHNDNTIVRGYYRGTNANYFGVITLSPIVIKVEEGDLIKLEYGTGATGSLTIAGGTYTYLTAEVME